MFGVFETKVRIHFQRPMNLNAWFQDWRVTHFGFIPGSQMMAYPMSHEAMTSDKVDAFYANTILSNQGFADAWDDYIKHYPDEVSHYRFVFRLQSEDAPRSPSPMPSPTDDGL